MRYSKSRKIYLLQSWTGMHEHKQARNDEHVIGRPIKEACDISK